MDFQDVYTRALNYAAFAHRSQTTKGGRYPYVVHLATVCMEAMAAFRSNKAVDKCLVIECALLHDVLEDTEIVHEVLANDFGQKVADGVLALSKDETLTKENQIPDSVFRIKQQAKEIWMVKMADRIANLQLPPAGWDRDTIISYQNSSRYILKELKEADLALSNRLEKKIEDYTAFIT